MIAFQFLAPAEVMTLNKRYHWARKMELVGTWRAAANIYARKWGIGPQPPSIVKVIFYVAANRRRDPHNYIATVKPIIDGLVDANVFPDDTGDWVAVVDPEFVVVGSKSTSVGMVRVELTER